MPKHKFVIWPHAIRMVCGLPPRDFEMPECRLAHDPVSELWQCAKIVSAESAHEHFALGALRGVI